MYSFCQNSLWRELVVFTQGLKSISCDSERKRVTVLSSFSLLRAPHPRLIHTSTGSVEGQPCFLFGTSLLLSLYNVEIHGGKARSRDTFCWLPEVSLSFSAAQRWLRQPAEAMHHGEWKTCSQGKEGNLYPSHQDAKEICVCIKRQLSSKGTGWDLLATLIALRDKKWQTMLED